MFKLKKMMASAAIVGGVIAGGALGAGVASADGFPPPPDFTNLPSSSSVEKSDAPDCDTKKPTEGFCVGSSGTGGGPAPSEYIIYSDTRGGHWKVENQGGWSATQDAFDSGAVPGEPVS